MVVLSVLGKGLAAVVVTAFRADLDGQATLADIRVKGRTPSQISRLAPGAPQLTVARGCSEGEGTACGDIAARLIALVQSESALSGRPTMHLGIAFEKSASVCFAVRKQRFLSGGDWGSCRVS